jgi:hypothetical protein
MSCDISSRKVPVIFNPFAFGTISLFSVPESGAIWSGSPAIPEKGRVTAATPEMDAFLKKSRLEFCLSVIVVVFVSSV